MKSHQSIFLSKDKCLACKLFSAPLFFLFGAFFSYKNQRYYKDAPRAMKVTLITIPLLLYAGGLVNTY